MFNYSSIVLLGNFNPAIFHPEWFDRYKILPVQDIQSALGEKPKIQEIDLGNSKMIINEKPVMIVDNGRSLLTFPSLKIAVNTERFDASIEHEDNIQVMIDAVIKIFTFLNHTPVNSFGFNFHGHIKYKQDVNDLLKNTFAADYGKLNDVFGDEFKVSGTIKNKFDIFESTLQLEQSNYIKDGLYYNFNLHHKTETNQAEESITEIKKRYYSSYSYCSTILRKMFGKEEYIWDGQKQN